MEEALKPNPIKYPLPIRIVQAGFPILEKLLPPMARWLGVKIFTTPFRFKYPVREAEFLEQAQKFDLFYENTRIQAYKWGQGPAIVVMHGWMGRASQWRILALKLIEKGYSVWACDAYGHGKSPGNYSNVIHFSSALMELLKEVGEVEAVVGHSLGAASIFNSMSRGQKFNKVVSISQPTIANDILDDFRARINASPKLNGAIRNEVRRLTGNEFEEYTTEHNVRYAIDIPYLVVHDQDDQEAKIDQAEFLHSKLHDSKLLITKGLGHFKILKDRKLMDEIVEFIES